MSLRWIAVPLLIVGTAWAGRAAAADDDTAADERLLRSARVGTDGPGLIEFFRKRTLRDADRANVQTLIRQLGDSSYRAREKASDSLVAVGPLARPFLRAAINDPDLEIARRAEQCLEQLEKAQEPPVVAAAARLLAQRKPPGAAETLLEYLPFAEDSGLVEEICVALATVAVREGKSEVVLVKALEDRRPLQRAAAGEALARAGAADSRPAVRRLLNDADLDVRQRVALALVEAKEKDAVPVLIALLGEMSRDRAAPVEDVLCRIAGDKTPPYPSGKDEAAQRKYRAAWESWWKENGPALDLAKIDLSQRLLGYTLIAFIDPNTGTGRIQELDAAGKVRWQIDNLRYPIDAQVIGADRVLITEYTGREVSERTLKGDVIWRRTLNLPLGARRLRNGNTFITARGQLLELDKDGKEVLNVTRPNDIAAACKLRDGQIAALTIRGQLVRMDASGKEVKSVPVGTVLSIGANLDPLPNGHVLVPSYSTNKVVEYDAEGKAVWEAPATRPTSVMRLPNGHVLVSSRNGRAVVELDRSGKEVWNHPVEGMPLRVLRR
jgi:outer membrane protein assembly factor BamB